MRGAVASRERALQAPADAAARSDEQPEDAQRLLSPRGELDAHRERREQLEAELQALASLDDAAFPYSSGNADPASCLCERSFSCMACAFSFSPSPSLSLS